MSLFFPIFGGGQAGPASRMSASKPVTVFPGSTTFHRTASRVFTPFNRFIFESDQLAVQLVSSYSFCCSFRTVPLVILGQEVDSLVQDFSLPQQLQPILELSFASVTYSIAVAVALMLWRTELALASKDILPCILHDPARDFIFQVGPKKPISVPDILGSRVGPYAFARDGELSATGLGDCSR